MISTLWHTIQTGLNERRSRAQIDHEIEEEMAKDDF